MPTIAFCLDDKMEYLLLLRVAVRTLRHVYARDGRTPPEIVCVYAGDEPRILRGLREEGVPLARYAPVIDPQGLPPSCRRAAGCFLKLELALVPELAACDIVLYCDADVLFLRNIDEIFTLRPAYLAMARELTAPFFHQHETLEYVWRGKNYTVPMPFPIWTYNSGTVLFNLEKLRRHGYIYSFLAFCEQNAERIGNLDQSLLNYFFGKRITKLPEKWNYAPYRGLTMEKASIVHLHGPKPWNGRLDWFASLRINDYDAVCAYWKSWLNEEEASLVAGWESSGR